MDKTLLTEGLTTEQKKNQEAVERDWNTFQTLLEFILEDYLSEEINLERFCLLITNCYHTFKGDTLSEIPDAGAYRLVGELLIRAMDNRPPKSKVTGSYPQSMKKRMAELVVMAHKDGYSLYSEDSGNAYQFIADRLTNIGFTVSERVVRESYRKHKPGT